MFSTKKILVKIGNSGRGKELSEQDLHKLQNHLVKMYNEIATVCNKYNLKYSLAYGNVLGAIRHNGWIPWDDDLDIHMPREDYDLFLSKYSKEMPDKYEVISYLGEGGTHARFAKVLDKTTTFVPITEQSSDHSCVDIDIFPIDNVPDSKIINSVYRIWSYFLMYTARSIYLVESDSKDYKNLMFSSSAGKVNWVIRQIWGRIFSFAPLTTWNRWIEQFAKNKKYTGYVHVMSDTELCYKRIPECVFFPIKEIDLPNIGRVRIPQNYDKYLTYCYGDWRKIPEAQDQWHHYVKEFNIPD